VVYDQGRREFNLGHYAEALALFEQAYKQQPVHRLLYNIGQCHRLLGNLEAARRLYRAFVAESPPEEPMLRVVREKLAEIEVALQAQTTARESAPSGLAPPEKPSPPSEKGPDKAQDKAPGKPPAHKK
jgi:tetratricopeptide (TPR) repeat protein